jgi:hypothetical protein
MSRRSTGWPSGRAVAGHRNDWPRRAALGTRQPDDMGHYRRLPPGPMRRVRPASGQRPDTRCALAHHRASRHCQRELLHMQPVPTHVSDSHANYREFARANPAVVPLDTFGIASPASARPCLSRELELTQSSPRNVCTHGCWSVSVSATSGVRRARACFCPSPSIGKATRSPRRTARAGRGISVAHELWPPDDRPPVD